MFPYGAGATTQRFFSSPLRQAKPEAPGRGVWRGAGVPAGDRGCALPGSCGTKGERCARSPGNGSVSSHKGRGYALPSPGMRILAPKER